MPLGTTNPFFNTVRSLKEQELIENMTIEAISIYGIDMIWVPRKVENYDQIYGEDVTSRYDTAIQTVVYVKSFDGFTGDRDFVSKFGLEIRDQANFVVSRRTFAETVGAVTSQPRPWEGDLIYFPPNDKCFQVKYVDKFPTFYQFGALQTWEMTVELFEYASEEINTGIPEIDRLMARSLDVLDAVLEVDAAGDDLMVDANTALAVKEVVVPAEDTGAVNAEANAIIDWSETDPFSNGVM